MSRLRKLTSPEFWVHLGSLSACVGMLLAILGFLTGKIALIQIGLWFSAPLFFGGILIVLLVIPCLLVANQRARRK